MADDLPTMEILIEAGAKVAYEQAVDLPWDEAAYHFKAPFLEDARAILSAVLPLVTGPAEGALASTTRQMTRYREELDAVDGRERSCPGLTESRARTVHDWLKGIG